MSDNVSIYAKIEPTIALKEMDIDDIESGTENENTEESNNKSSVMGDKIPSLQSHYTPIVKINDYIVMSNSILNLEIDCNYMIPTISVTFYDLDDSFSTRNFPKDGDVLCFYMGAGDGEKTFKPIRADFNIKNITNLSSDINKLYKIYGELNIDYLYNENCSYYKDMTSYDALLKIASELKIGFASNIENTDDKQTWLNCYNSKRDLIENITRSSYKDEISFFTSYIDLYYYLNYVECNSIFNDSDNDTGDETTAPISKVSNSFTDLKIYKKYSDIDDDSVENYDYLTNDPSMLNNDTFISSYGVVSNSNNIKDMIGYKAYLNYYDMNNEEYIQEFITPITSEGSKLEPVNKPTKNINEIENNTRTNWLGIQSDNVHANYKHSLMNNKINVSEFDKYGLEVTLPVFNPRIIKMQKIYCKIYNKDPNKRWEELTQEQIEQEVAKDDPKYHLVDKKLTGWYVVTGYKFVFNDGIIQTTIQLRKRAISNQ